MSGKKENLGSWRRRSFFVVVVVAVAVVLGQVVFSFERAVSRGFSPRYIEVDVLLQL